MRSGAEVAYEIYQKDIERIGQDMKKLRGWLSEARNQSRAHEKNMLDKERLLKDKERIISQKNDTILRQKKIRNQMSNNIKMGNQRSKNFSKRQKKRHNDVMPIPVLPGLNDQQVALMIDHVTFSYTTFLSSGVKTIS